MTENFTKQKRLTIIILMLTAFLLSIFDPIIAQRLSDVYQVYYFASSFVGVVLVYSWYFMDRTERGEQRSKLTFLVFILFGLLFFPFYLFGKRSSGKRLQVALKFFGFLVLYFGLSYLGVFLGGIVA